jgi:hypothetical protein
VPAVGTTMAIPNSQVLCPNNMATSADNHIIYFTGNSLLILGLVLPGLYVGSKC